MAHTAAADVVVETLEERQRRLNRQYATKYRAANCEKVRAAAAKWASDNPEKNRAKSKRWRDSHLEYIKDRDRKYRLKRPDAGRAAGKRWNAANPAKASVRRQRRRARFHGAEGTFTALDVILSFCAQRGQCFYCCELLSDFHVDHKQPLARGGTNWSDNIAIACPSCNCAKRDKTVEEYLRYRREVAAL